MLRNTFFKLRNNMPLTVAYLGGSITEGAGVDREQDCWRCKITEWFRKNYPKSEIIEINAGIGGTASDFGMFRCDSQVLASAPDLIFVEFAVNDTTISNSLVTMETVIRKIMRSNPITDIVLVETATQSMHRSFLNNESVESVETYKKISKYYGIDIINVGEEIISRVDGNEGGWDKYTMDTVHPNAIGYSLYTNEIIKYLSENLVMPSPITSDVFQNAKMVDFSECITDFEITDQSFCGRCDGYLEAFEKGRYIEFKFTGSCVGIYNMIASDSGDFVWSVDGSEPQKRSTWDEYALEFDRTHYCILEDKLEYGEHTLRVEVTGERNVQSKGTYIRIGAFLVA